MDLEVEKKNIIDALQNRNEEWLIKAIKKLLDIDTEEAFSSEHKSIIEERIQMYKANPANVITLDQLKTELKAEGKL